VVPALELGREEEEEEEEQVQEAGIEGHVGWHDTSMSMVTAQGAAAALPAGREAPPWVTHETSHSPHREPAGPLWGRQALPEDTEVSMLLGDARCQAALTGGP
jgi:hypothetical protein